MDEEALSWFVDYDIARAMLQVKGVGAVARRWCDTRQVEVELDPEKLLALKCNCYRYYPSITLDSARRLRQSNQNWGQRTVNSYYCNRQNGCRDWCNGSRAQ